MSQPVGTTTVQISGRNPVGRPRKDKLPAGSVPKQPPKRPRGRPRKDRKPPGSVKRVPTTLSSDVSAPSNPDPRRGPKAGTFILSATEAVYNIRVPGSSSGSDTVGSDNTDISERMVQATEKYLENTGRNRQRDVSRERMERENKDDAQDSGTPMFRYDHYEYGVEAGQETIGHMEEGYEEEEEETEKEGGREESKRRAELRRREVARRRQKRECEAHGCHLEVCNTNHEAKANVDRFMEGLEERTKRIEPIVVETDEQAVARASTGEATRWPLVFDYPRSSDSLLESSFQDLELEDYMDY